MNQVAQTSLFVYRTEIKPTLGERQKAVYETLVKKGSMTNTEIAAWLNAPINTITPRIYELRNMGLVRLVETRKCNITGRTCCAWEIGKIIN